MSTSASSIVELWQKKVQTPSFREKRGKFRKLLLQWFATNGRDLPWRKTHDPYKILLSELMLQQTQVERVKDFYRKFLDRFPDFQSVAQAEEKEILQYWEGLGYYNRARNLQKTAKLIVEKYNNNFPLNKEEILALPGLGEYTAGAVMTFALNLRQPIVDTNVNRVISRVFLPRNFETQTSKSEYSKILWLLSENLLPEQNFWEFNQGIMDFGAIQCSAFKPKCNTCPFRSFCRDYTQNSLSRFL